MTMNVLAIMLGLLIVVASCAQKPPIESADVDFGRPAPRPRRVVKSDVEEPKPQAVVQPPNPVRAPEPVEPAATEDRPAPQANGGSGPSSGGGGTGEDSGGESGGSNAGDGASTTADPKSPSKGDGPPAPAFPGRGGSRSNLSPDQAAAAAKRLLNRARAAVRAGDQQAAGRDAIAAFEAVQAHAAENADCAGLMADAERLLAALGPRQQPIDVPTEFR
ncbi:MAG: hypothetical protein HQ464_03360 [Planctomycetes bacterium]|nr:hypothetical protein [Planctomycetota bacterium]